MAATYMPLVGGSNIIEVRDSGGTACELAEISGVDSEGRAGSLKTSFLVALAGAVEATTSISALWETLGSFDIYAPFSHPVPSSLAATNFDYSSILPVTRASLVCASFVPTGDEWPASLSALLLAMAPEPGQVYQLKATLTGLGVPAANPLQYGSYTFRLSGGVADDAIAPIANPLILIEVDFSHSIAN